MLSSHRKSLQNPYAFWHQGNNSAWLHWVLDGCFALLPDFLQDNKVALCQWGRSWDSEARHRRMPLWRWFSTHSTSLPAIQPFFLKLFCWIIPFYISTNWLASGIFKTCPKSVNFQAVRHPHLLISQGKKKPQTIERSMWVLTSCLWTNIVTSNRFGENSPIDEYELIYTELKLDPISLLKLLQLTK